MPSDAGTGTAEGITVRKSLCAPACGLGSILEHDKLLSARATDFGVLAARKGLPHGTHKPKDTVDGRDRMSTTAPAAGYNEERRLAKLARLRGTGRRRRQPQHHAMTSPPPPDDAFSPPPPNEAPPENWDDVPVGKGRTPQRRDDDDDEPAAYDGGSWRSASKPARAPRSRASPTKVPTAREWDDTPVGGAQRPPPQQAERKRAPARRPVVSQREWDEMPVGKGGGGQVWTEYPEGQDGPPPRVPTPDSDSDSTGSLEMRPAPRDWARLGRRAEEPGGGAGAGAARLGRTACRQARPRGTPTGGRRRAAGRQRRRASVRD